ncbi:MAG: hypothetical protein PHI59_05675 [Candidatus Omnitrophica bacterium]|nr:hypothetical protein [Candidatus Omnitrophota bacterium]
MMSKDIFSVDISTIEQYGVDKWLKDFYWPVSDDDFNKLYEDIRHCFTAELKRHSDTVQTLAGVVYEKKFEFANILHALKVIRCTEDRGEKIIYSDRTWWYRDIIEGNRITSRGSSLEAPRGGIKKKIKSIASASLKSLRYNGIFRKYLNAPRREEAITVLDSVNDLMEQYIRKIGAPIRFMAIHDWMPKEGFESIPGELRREIEEFSRSISDELFLIASRHGMTLNKGHIDNLRSLLEQSMTRAAVISHFMKNKLNSDGRKIRLLFSGVGNPVARALGALVRQNGGTVTAFWHAYDVSFLNSPISLMSFSDLFFADELITYTKKGALLYEQVKRNYPDYMPYDLPIRAVEGGKNFLLPQKNSGQKLPKNNRRIMIIGYPHNQWRKALVTGGFSLTNLDLELRLVGVLGRAGYEVLYKAHPCSADKVEGIFKSKAKVIKGYFSDSYEMADTYLFPSVATTSFITALGTNKPIIALDLSFKSFEPFREPMELLKKRCSIVGTKTDERNRVIFDEKGLLDALAKKPEKPNNEFVETYMFPERTEKAVI